MTETPPERDTQAETPLEETPPLDEAPPLDEGPEWPEPEELPDPELRIHTPDRIALAGDLRPLTIEIKNYRDGVGDEMQIRLPAEVARDVALQLLDEGRTHDVPLVVDESGNTATATVPVRQATVELLMGVDQASYEAAWLDSLPDVVAADPGAGIGPLPTAVRPVGDWHYEGGFNVEARLLLDREVVVDYGEGGGDWLPIDNPTLRVAIYPGLDAFAGHPFNFGVEIVNTSGYDYPPPGGISVFHQMALLTVDELERLRELEALRARPDVTEDELGLLSREIDALYAVDEGQLHLSCSSPETEPFETFGGGDRHDVFGWGSYVYSGALADLSRFTLDCAMTVDTEVHGGLLMLSSVLLVGEHGAPLGYDSEAGTRFIELHPPMVPTDPDAEAPSDPEPEPKPTQPVPAKPAPVRPTPSTPSKPPAAAPIRQVSNERLPRTGTDPLPLAAAGLGLVLAGAAALLGGRRRADNGSRLA
jgi:LPXTG-motif cell wall-anchored protein